jgi:hypothetical protein
MAPTSPTKWFIHAKNLEAYKELQQCNLPAVHCLSGWVSLEAKDDDWLHWTAVHHLIFIGVLETPFKHHLMASNKHSFGFQYDY